MILQTNAPLNVKVKEGAMLLCIDGLLFVCCIVGRTFNEIVSVEFAPIVDALLLQPQQAIH